jgi:hypothetical protein
MKKTLNIDDKLLKDARVASAAATDTETVRLGLEALVRQAAYQTLQALCGSEPDAMDIPRRREAPQPHLRGGFKPGTKPLRVRRSA